MNFVKVENGKTLCETKIPQLHAKGEISDPVNEAQIDNTTQTESRDDPTKRGDTKEGNHEQYGDDTTTKTHVVWNTKHKSNMQ